MFASTSVSKMLARKISNLGMFCGTAHQSTSDKNKQKGELSKLWLIQLVHVRYKPVCKT